MGSGAKKAWLTRNVDDGFCEYYDVWIWKPEYADFCGKWYGPCHHCRLGASSVDESLWMNGGCDAIVEIEVDVQREDDCDYLSIVGKWGGE